MSTTKNLKILFEELVDAYEDGNDEAKLPLLGIIKNSGKDLHITIDDELQWEESLVNGYKECPVVIQSIEVFLGNELIYECNRFFGSEKIDPTHTRLGERWVTIRVDDGDHDGLIELLEDFGHTVDEPDVPEWK